MFERFTKPARQAVLGAVREAEREQTDRVAAEHLLLALLDDTTRSAPLLAAAGLTRQAVVAAVDSARRRGGLTAAEADALGELGIDVATVVDRIEAVHGENALAAGPPRRSRFAPRGHLPFTAAAKSVLVGGLREAREHGDRHIGDEHLLLALAAGTGVTAHVLADHGLSYAEIRAHLAKAS